MSAAGIPTTVNSCAATGSGECIASSSVFTAGLPSLPELGSPATFSVSLGTCSG
ncbi:hypothetical protein QCA50_013215 [Cerrena zonata]|uniref:Uncharacterized protein n=1 Tax=Cerrena zonata TaxID=2478898 RepID=A0AAW0FXL5_9APHY